MKMKLLWLFMMVICIDCVRAQKPVPVNEQWVFFPYATGERTDKKLKVLIIGTHILRYKNLDAAYTKLGSVGLSLDFSKVLDPIEHNEIEFTADYDNIKYGSNKVEELNGSYLSWNASTVRDNDLVPSDNTLSAIEKIRVKIIDGFRAQGYKVYQVDFTPPSEGASFVYYDAASSVYRPYLFEKIAPLSPLYVQVYRKGEIKDMLAKLAKGSVSTGYSGITIESKDEKKETKPNKQVITGGSHKMTDEEIKTDIGYRKTIAESYTVEGDRLYAFGSGFYAAALEKYNLAQASYYSADVQRRIDEINAWSNLGKGLAAGIEGFNELAKQIDPKGKTRKFYWLFTYTGLGANYSKITNKGVHQASDATLAWSTHLLLISVEGRLGYYKSPVYEYAVEGPANGQFTNTVQVQNSTLGAGLSAGLNIPLNFLVLYALYGIDARALTLEREMLGSQFRFDDINGKADLPIFGTRTSLGLIFKIPKTKIGIGVQYNMHSINGETGQSKLIRNSSNPNAVYYMRRTTDEKYQFQNWG
jgi:hypothetical protein